MPNTTTGQTHYRFHPLFNKFLRIFVGPYISRRFKITGINLDIFEDLEPPFLVMGNHVNNWDPFIMNLLIPHQVFWVTSDVHFRNPLLKAVMSMVGCISKKKGAPDVQTIRDIMTVRDMGGVIGVFPEGQASWDGGSLPIFPATAKLLRIINIPVVTGILRGSFLARPRWQREKHDTAVSVKFNLPFKDQSLKDLSVDEIRTRLTDSLYHDEYAFQKTAMQVVTGDKRAEYLERVLFLCPECGTEGNLISLDDTVGCKSCGYKVRYNTYGLFELAERSASKTLHYDNLRDWNLWQQKILEDRIDSLMSSPDTPVLHEGGVRFRRGGKRGSVKVLGEGDLTLFTDRIRLQIGGQDNLDIPLDILAGVNVQTEERLEFYNGETLIRCQYVNPAGCIYKFYSAIRYLQQGNA